MMYCKYCDKDVFVIENERPDTPHNCEIKCAEGHFIKWKPKDKNINKRQKSKFKPSDLEIDYCQWCLRYELGKNEVLEIHHIIEIRDGGEDVKDNILVLCTACHSLVHWTRVYLNKHQING